MKQKLIHEIQSINPWINHAEKLDQISRLL